MPDQLRILHLEDDPVDAELIEATLQADGVSAVITRVASQADFAVALDQHTFDIILSDYRLPGFNGLAALSLARRRNLDLPFILVSGVLAEDDAIDALRAGATDFVLKTRLNRLTPAVRRALAEAHERRERQRAQQLIEVRARQQVAVARLGMHALAGANLPALFDELVAVVAETLEVEFSKLLELQPDGLNLLVVAGVGWSPGTVGRTLVTTDSQSQAGYTLHSSASIIVDHLPSETRFTGMPILHEHGVISGMTVVVPGQPRPYGVLGVHSARQRIFTPEDANFLQAAANVLAEAIVRLRTEQQLDRHARRAQALAEASQAFALAAADQQPALDLLARRVAEHVGDACTLRLLGEDGQSLPLVAAWHPVSEALELIHELAYTEDQPGAQSMVRDVMSTGQPRRVSLAANPEARWSLSPHWQPYIDRFGVHAALSVPLVARGRVLGVLSAMRDLRPEGYTDDDLEFAQMLANRAALAIDNARLYRAEQQARHAAQQAATRISRLQAVTAALSQALTPGQVVAAFVEHGLPALGAAAGFLALLDDDGRQLHAVQATGFSEQFLQARGPLLIHDDMPLAEAVRTGKPVWLESPEAILARYPRLAELLTGSGFAAGAAVPIIIQGQPAGGLLASFAANSAFGADERALIVAVAQQCAQALERARLYEAEQAARHESQAAEQRATRAAERIRQLQAITAAFSTALNAGQVAEVVMNHGLDVVGAMAGSVVVLAPDGYLDILAARGYPAQTLEAFKRFSLHAPLPLADAVRERQPIWLNDRQVLGAGYPHLAAYPNRTGQAAAAVPLVVQGRAMGAIGLSFAEEQAFEPDVQSFILSLADQCAQALERGRLYEAEQAARQAAEQAVERTQRLQYVTAALSASLTVPQLAEVIVQHSAGALGASTTAVYLASDDGRWLEMAASRGIPEAIRQAASRLPVDSDNPGGDVFRSRKPVWLESIEAVLERYPGLAEARAATGNQALAVVPLLAGDQSLGILSLSFAEPREFTEAERSLLLALAGQCAQAAERALFYAQLEQLVAVRTAELQAANAALQREIGERQLKEAELKFSYEQLRDLAGRLQSAREEERRRVARELHDELGGLLTGLKMDVAQIRRGGRELQPATRERLEALSSAIDSLIGLVRRIATDLRPGILDDLGLLAAIEWQVEDFSKRSGVACSLSLPPEDPMLEPECATAVFRVLQESLTNVARHAQASRVEIALEQVDGHLTLRVRDDGRGFSLGEASRHGSLGLAGMRERVYAYSGQLTISSQPGQGTVIEMKLPV
jgi:GAF domain-containing protein/CheY-like chemotaxis protein/two-component sensor histidine kinase